VLRAGAEKARVYSAELISVVRKAVGLKPLG
jgi:hypothetical protein